MICVLYLPKTWLAICVTAFLPTEQHRLWKKINKKNVHLLAHTGAALPWQRKRWGRLGETQGWGAPGKSENKTTATLTSFELLLWIDICMSKRLYICEMHMWFEQQEFFHGSLTSRATHWLLCRLGPRSQGTLTVVPSERGLPGGYHLSERKQADHVCSLHKHDYCRKKREKQMWEKLHTLCKLTDGCSIDAHWCRSLEFFFFFYRHFHMR